MPARRLTGGPRPQGASPRRAVALPNAFCAPALRAGVPTEALAFRAAAPPAAASASRHRRPLSEPGRRASATDHLPLFCTRFAELSFHVEVSCTKCVEGFPNLRNDQANLPVRRSDFVPAPERRQHPRSLHLASANSVVVNYGVAQRTEVAKDVSLDVVFIQPQRLSEPLTILFLPK